MLPSRSKSSPSAVRVLLLLAAGLAVVAATPTGQAGAASTAVRMPMAPSQELAELLTSHTATLTPGRGSVVLRVVAARRPLTGARTVLPVIGRSTAPDGAQWLQVLLPGRPNGQKGWIRESGTRIARTSWRIVVDISERTVAVYEHGHSLRIFPAIVGKTATPTPRGNFFVEEDVQLQATDVGGPYALALSARSNALHEYAGGPGQIALHGQANIGGVLGSAASHGCVRLDTASIDWLAHHAGPGTPVTIRA